MLRPTQTLTTDKALQQTLIEDAIKSLTTGERVEATVPALIEKTFNQTWYGFFVARFSPVHFTRIYLTFITPPRSDDVEVELDNREPLDAAQKDLFAKRFDFPTKITEDMLKKAKGDDVEAALLVAKVGGGKPSAGQAITQKSPLEFVA